MVCGPWASPHGGDAQGFLIVAPHNKGGLQAPLRIRANQTLLS